MSLQTHVHVLMDCLFFLYVPISSLISSCTIGQRISQRTENHTIPFIRVFAMRFQPLIFDSTKLVSGDTTWSLNLLLLKPFTPLVFNCGFVHSMVLSLV